MAAILDDPLNRAIAERELARRSRPLSHGLAPPPVPREGGGFLFLTMREFQRHPRNMIPKDDEVDYLADVFKGSDGWWVCMYDQSEVGPFPDLVAAQKAALSLLSDEGYEVLTQKPWTVADAEAYPFTTTLL